MYLTHLDKDGNDSPAILMDNTTAANRAVNIPEFVNIPADGLMQIDDAGHRFLPVVRQRLGSGEEGAVRAGHRRMEEGSRTEPGERPGA